MHTVYDNIIKSAKFRSQRKIFIRRKEKAMALTESDAKDYLTYSGEQFFAIFNAVYGKPETADTEKLLSEMKEREKNALIIKLKTTHSHPTNEEYENWFFDLEKRTKQLEKSGKTEKAKAYASLCKVLLSGRPAEECICNIINRK